MKPSVRRRATQVMRQQGPLTTRPSLLAGEEFPPEPRQKRSLDKRERLKAAALALFAEKGYERTSIDEIVGRANLAVGGFYQHFESKRQLLLALMDELLANLGRLDLHPRATSDIRAGLHELLSNAFSTDLRYLGVYRAWQEAVLADEDLAHKQEKIHIWTIARITAVFEFLHELPGSRPDLDIAALARAMDTFFWSLIAEAVRSPDVELKQSIDSATHLIYHAIFTDSAKKGRTTK